MSSNQDVTISQWQSGHDSGYKAAWKYHDENHRAIPSRNRSAPAGSSPDWRSGWIGGWLDARLDIIDRYRDEEEEQ